MMYRYLLLLLLTGLFAIPSFAQSGNSYRISDRNYHAWYMYFGDHKLSSRWGIHTEAQFRRADIGEKGQQLLLRTAVNYHAGKGVMLSLGYGYIETYPYGDYPSQRAFPEHRIYQQLQLNDAKGRFLMQHRFRMEERFIQYPINSSILSPDYTYQSRFRYMYKLTLPLQGPVIDDNEFYLSAYNEIFIGAGKNVLGNVFDQNRIYGAIGYALNPDLKFEVGYMQQVLNHRKRIGIMDVYEYNHTLQAAVTWNLSKRKSNPIAR